MATNKKIDYDASFIIERTERKKKDKERSKRINKERHLKDIRKLQDIKTNYNLAINNLLNNIE